MKITTEHLPNCEIALDVQPDESQVQDALRQAARKIARNYNIPGFRKGKAPYSAVVRAYGKEVLFEQIVEEMGDKIYKQALEESGLEPIAPGTLKDVSFEPLVFHLTLPMPPELDLGDYRSIRMEREPVEVDEEEVEAQLIQMQERQTEWAPVEEGGAQSGDLITMKLQAIVGEDEVLVDDEAFELVLEAESEDFPPGFEAQFLAQEPGAQLDFDLTYPEDWRSDRAGKAVHFEAEVLSIKRQDVPSLDDDFAPLVGEFDTLDALRGSIREGLRAQREHTAITKYANDVIDKIIEGAPRLEYPPIMVEDALDRLVEQQQRELQRMGLPLEEFLRMTGQTPEDFRSQYRESAENRLLGDLVLEKLAQLERITADDEEVTQEIDALLAEAGPESSGYASFLKSEAGRAVVSSDIVRRKAVDRLIQIAEGTAPELEADAKTEVEAEAKTEVEAEAEVELEAEAGLEVEPSVETTIEG